MNRIQSQSSTGTCRTKELTAAAIPTTGNSAPQLCSIDTNAHWLLTIANYKRPSSAKFVDKQHTSDFAGQGHDAVEALEKKRLLGGKANTLEDLGTIVLCCIA